MYIFKLRHRWIFFLVLILSLFFSFNFCIVNEIAAQPKEPNAQISPEENEIIKRVDSLKSILSEISQIKQQLKSKQSELNNGKGKGLEDDLKSEIALLVDRLNSLESSFDIVATKVDKADNDADDQNKDFSWANEAKELLSPLLSELKKLTSRPREIDQLQTEIAREEKDISEAKLALSNISQLVQSEKDTGLNKALDKLSSQWNQRLQSSATQLSIAQQKLNQKLTGRKGFVDSIQDLPQLFFRSRGRNLAIALLVTLLFWFLVRKLQSRFESKQFVKNFSSRLINVLFLLTYIFGSLLVFVFVLFVFGDWVLLILAMLVLIGLVWASRQAIPIFWTQITLLLDVGSVREGERIIIDGIPWKVSKLNFYTELTNPALIGGKLRIPLKDIVGLRSRKFSSKEKWFPTEVGDWVVVSDGTYGKVVQQSSELVEIEMKGGARKFYPTTSFLGFTPEVLSKGFRIQVVFGLDYSLQKIVTSEVIELFKVGLLKSFADLGINEDDLKLNVEFAEAGESSLNLALLCDFQGKLASEYQSLRRLIQKISVDICNQHGWEIPFRQLTVHMRDGNLT